MNERRWILVGLSGPAKGSEYVLLADEIKIGRTEENDIVLPEKSVSRHHASLFIGQDGFWLQDMNSKNGTFLNQEKITKTSLKRNDAIKIGQSKLKVDIDKGDPVDLRRWEPLVRLLADQRSKRAIMVVGVVVFIFTAVLFMPRKVDRTDSPEPKTASRADRQREEQTVEASEAQVSEWVAQADAATQYEDFNRALFLLKKAGAARPDDLKIKSKLKQVESKLKSMITLYDENGAREYEKLNYERAINEWRTVVALTKDVDPDTYEEAQRKIRDAEEKLKQKRP